ncbi:RagB/SusD family nutrient uptake outer membrane protein [Maribellus maritimus]|uniref:RagB/SusD family nutrient uptake outer membrane protein n=1 Tax=Maribellus maritimus TaxID=2870838 RepID=UPI001EEA2088|nr:RagB/SusD family nutrient uptake outer membrane protein [Maribellus maritimus]MCG6189382.1 RagB/SusD family nutrient uptake outer membrane protein [Maribellus maritimus]
MKKILFIIFVAFAFSSCEDFLTEKPKDLMDPAAFYNSDDEAIASVNGVYARLNYYYNNGGGTNGYSYYSCLGTDIGTMTGGRENNGQHYYHVYTMTPDIIDGRMRGTWRELYRAIGDANLCISRVSASENISDGIKDRVVAEAKTLRALFYYMLTNWWGDVPMWLEELNVTEVGGEIPKTPVADIRAQMVKDLTDAIPYLPEQYSGSDVGRVTKWAASMLLTKVYLWQQDWPNAKATAGSIINSGDFSLMENYEDVFGKDHEYNAERIWEIDYVVDIHTSTLPTKYNIRGVDKEPNLSGAINTNLGYGLHVASKEFLETFDPEDKRYNSYDFYHSLGLDESEYHYHYITKNMNLEDPKGNTGSNTIIYRLADAYLMYAEAENELNGPTADAYEKINTIRTRAFDDSSKMLSGLTKESFRQAIMDERKWELGFEFQRRWDLIRWGKLVEAVKSMATTNPWGAENVQSYHSLLPIPPAEIVLNPALEQNPGY